MLQTHVRVSQARKKVQTVNILGNHTFLQGSNAFLNYITNFVFDLYYFYH